MSRPVCIGGLYALGVDVFTVTAVTVGTVCLRSGSRFAQVDRETFRLHFVPVP